MLNSVQEPLEFEDLSAIYRIEKKAPSLSAVRRDLYPAMVALLKDLNTEYSKQLSNDPDSLMCEGANQRRKKAKQLSKEIVESRMQKICSMALRGAMGAQNTTDQLTPEEREYYNNILEISKKHDNILSKLTSERRYESPKIDLEPIKTKTEPTQAVDPKPQSMKENIQEKVPTEIKIPNDIEPEMNEPVFDEFPPEEELSENKMAEDDATFTQNDVPTPETTTLTPIVEKKQDNATFVLLRIIEDLPTFSGPDRDYNLSKEDIVRMPKIMADALVNRKKAVQITPTE